MSEATALISDPLFRWGRSWFRWRSVSPLPFFVVMVVVRPEFEWHSFAWLVPVLGILLAESLRLWAVGYAGSATRTRGDSVPALVHAGPYRWIRNPLYVANIALYSLAAVLFGFVQLSLILGLYSCVQYILIVHYEEALLENTFGAPYRDYQNHVPKWVPSFQAYPASAHDFDLGRAFRSERSTFVSMTSLAILLLAKQAWFS